MNCCVLPIDLTILILVRLSGCPVGERWCCYPGKLGASEGAGETADSVVHDFATVCYFIHQDLLKTKETELLSAQVENSFLIP